MEKKYSLKELAAISALIVASGSGGVFLAPKIPREVTDYMAKDSERSEMIIKELGSHGQKLDTLYAKQVSLKTDLDTTKMNLKNYVDAIRRSNHHQKYGFLCDIRGEEVARSK